MEVGTNTIDIEEFKTINENYRRWECNDAVVEKLKKLASWQIQNIIESKLSELYLEIRNILRRDTLFNHIKYLLIITKEVNKRIVLLSNDACSNFDYETAAYEEVDKTVTRDEILQLIESKPTNTYEIEYKLNCIYRSK